MFFDLSAVSHIMRIPTDEEWDLFMDAVHEDDSIAHWKGVFSWTNAPSFADSSSRMVRGYNEARFRGFNGMYSRYAGIGFRPAFDSLPSELTDSMADGQLAVVGTLYMAGKPVCVRKKRESFFLENDDIANYVPDAKLEMRPALEDPAYWLTAVKVGSILVSARVPLKNISYADIKEALKPDYATYPELRFYNRDHYCDARRPSNAANAPCFTVEFDVGTERYHCVLSAADADAALGAFFRTHPNINFNMVAAITRN